MMPDPREAVYDVLLAKKRRADEAREAIEASREAWEKYMEDNARAEAVYNATRRR